MKIFLQYVLNVIGLLLLACKQPLLTPMQFTQAHVAALRERVGYIQVEVLRDLELQIAVKDKDATIRFSLERAYYDAYVQAPERKDELIALFVAGVAESVNAERAKTWDSTRFLPLIKPRKWLEGREKVIYDDFNSDLVIVYAEDQEKLIQYLSSQDIEKAGVAREGLRALAIKNLMTNISIEEHGGNGVYMLTAGGEYEASLILAESIMKRYQLKVNGLLVAAIPTTDLLLLTGSNDEAGLSILRQSISSLNESDALILTTQILIYNENGKLSVMGS